MWLTVAVDAIGAGIQIFSQVRQNNALKSAGADAIAKAKANTELGVLKADAAYLGALGQSSQTTAQADQERAILEANQKRLRTVAIIGGVALAVIIFVIAAVKTRKS